MLFLATLGALFVTGGLLFKRRKKRDGLSFLFAAASTLLTLLAFLMVKKSLALQKFVAYLIMPTGAVWLLMLLGVAHYALKRQRSTAAWLAFLSLAYALTGNVWLGAALISTLERQYPPHPIQTHEPFDAIFVLGGGAELDAHHGARVTNAGDRTVLAARFYHAKKTAVLIASGRSIHTRAGPGRLVYATQKLWMDLGVPREAIKSIPGPANTKQEVEAYREMIHKERFRRVGVLSSAYHLPRIMRHVERHNLKMIPIPADRRGQVPPFAPMFLVPNPQGFQTVFLACWEWVGMLVGR